MNSVELMDKRNQLRIQAESILTNAEKETRKLNEDELTKFETLKKEIEDIDVEMKKLSDKLKNETTKEVVRENYYELFYPTEKEWREKTIADFKAATEGVLKAKLK